MAKSTNHTAHNQSYKNHRNGIKKPDALQKGQRRSLKGVSDNPTRAAACPCLARGCLAARGGSVYTSIGSPDPIRDPRG